MNKKLFSICCMLLLTLLILSIQSPALDITDPQIEDEVGDVPLSMYDIVSARFFEDQNQPEYLFTTMEIRDLSGRKSTAVYSIRWSFQDTEYVCGLDTAIFKDNIFRIGDPKRATTRHWKSMPECEGIIDVEESIITWKIPKSTIGNPSAGDRLEDTRAHAAPGFPYSFLFFIIGQDVRDFAPQYPETYGEDYIIQY